MGAPYQLTEKTNVHRSNSDPVLILVLVRRINQGSGDISTFVIILVYRIANSFIRVT